MEIKKEHFFLKRNTNRYSKLYRKTFLDLLIYSQDSVCNYSKRKVK